MRKGTPQLVPRLDSLSAQDEKLGSGVILSSSFQVATSNEVIPVERTLMAFLRLA